MEGARHVSPRTQKAQQAESGWTTQTEKMVTRHFRPGLSDQQVAKLRDMFDVLDGDNSGTIDEFELRYGMRELGIVLDQREFDKMFAEVDRNRDGHLDFNEFVALMTGFLEEENAQKRLTRVYNLFTDKRTGKISLRTLARKARELDLQLTDSEIRDMFMMADKNRDGQIDVDEFSTIVREAGLFQPA